MRYCWIALMSLAALTANAQQSTLTLARVAGTNVIQLNPSSGDVSFIIGTNKPAGTCYLLAPGVYPCFYPMDVPTNGWISGSGWNTVLINYYTNSGNNPVALIHPTDNSITENLCITNFFLGSDSVEFQSSWGMHSAQPNHSPCANALIRNCLIFGSSDAIYINNSVVCSGRALSCTITSRWDANVFLNEAHKFEYFDCIVSHSSAHDGKGFNVSNVNDDGAQLTLNGCQVYSRGGASAVAVLTSDASTVFEAYNCVFTNAVSPVVNFSGGGSGKLMNCNITRGQVSDGGTGGTLILPFAQTCYQTNLMPIGFNPDFNVPVCLVSTNNVVQFQACTNVDVSKTLYQYITMYVTNTTPATPRAIIAPVNCTTNGRALSIPFVTNLTEVIFKQYGQKFTNMEAKPIF